MSKHPFLLSIIKELKKNEFKITFVDDNIATVAMNKESSPFLFLIIEEKYHGVILSFAIDFPFCTEAVNIALLCLKHAPVATGESFYYGNDGELYWDIEALERMELEQNPALLDQWTPSNKKDGAH